MVFGGAGGGGGGAGNGPVWLPRDGGGGGEGGGDARGVGMHLRNKLASEEQASTRGTS